MRKVKNSATGLIRIDYIIDEQHCIFVNETFTKTKTCNSFDAQWFDYLIYFNKLLLGSYY